MRKWIIGGSVLLLLFIAFLVALLNINAYVERNRDYLIEQAQNALNRRISVGEIEVSIWNGIGVRFQDFTLADDPAFSSDDFVRAKDLQANARLLPLLRGEVQVKRLILNQPTLNIIRNKKGVYNFSTIGATEKDKGVRRDKESETADTAERAAFLISLLDMSAGEVRYRDLTDGTSLHARQVDLEVRDLDFNAPFSIDLAVALFAAKQNVRINARVGPLPEDHDYSKTSFDGGISIDSLDLNQLKSALPKFRNILPKDLEVGGVLSMKELKLKGTLQSLAVNGSLQATDGTIRYGDSFSKPAGIPLTLTTQARYASDKIILDQTALQLHTLPLKIAGEILLGARTAVNLTLNSEPAALEGWEKLIPALSDYGLEGKAQVLATVRGPLGGPNFPQIEGKGSLQGARFRISQLPRPIDNINTQIVFSGQRAELKETTLNLGSSPIRLAANIERFSPLALSYKLSASQLAMADIEKSLPEQRQKDTLRDVRSEGGITSVKGGTTVSGTINSSDGSLYNLAYKNLQANVSYDNKLLTLRDLSANLLNGAARLTGEYAANEIPRFTVTSELKAIDLVQLYRYFEMESQRDIRGNLNGNIKLTGQGDRWESIKANLRGQGQTEVLQGAILNFNIADTVLSGATGVPGLTNLISPAVRKKYPETFAAKDTEFKELQTQLELGDSRLNFKNLRIAAAQFRVEGNGWADFERRVDFRGVVRFSPQLSADLAGALRETRLLFNSNNELEIPFVVAGEMPNVRPRPDTSYLTKTLQRGLLQRGAEELQQMFGPRERRAPSDSGVEQPREPKQDSPENLIRKGLEGLFGRQRDRR